MQRICFVLQVKPERIQEYKERHRSVWPEMQKALQETGWNNYSLFLRADGLLVGFCLSGCFSKPQALEAWIQVWRNIWCFAETSV
jgi:L-rhamnose mutarotase